MQICKITYTCLPRESHPTCKTVTKPTKCSKYSTRYLFFYSEKDLRRNVLLDQVERIRRRAAKNLVASLALALNTVFGGLVWQRIQLKNAQKKKCEDGTGKKNQERTRDTHEEAALRYDDLRRSGDSIGKLQLRESQEVRKVTPKTASQSEQAAGKYEQSNSHKGQSRPQTRKKHQIETLKDTSLTERLVWRWCQSS